MEDGNPGGGRSVLNGLPSPRDVDLSLSVSHYCCLQPVNSVGESLLFFFNCSSR